MGFTAQLEDQIWLKSGSWKGYCRRLARKAASLGHAGCLRVLRELGGEAAASLAAADAAHGQTPAHSAAYNGHEGCLRVLHELGAEASLARADAKGWTPAHFAAGKGHEGCLRVLEELGGDVAASLVAADDDRYKSAHYAAEKGHEGCLRVLHELGSPLKKNFFLASDRHRPIPFLATTVVYVSPMGRCTHFCAAKSPPARDQLFELD